MYSIVKVSTQNKISVIHVNDRILTYDQLDDLVSGSAEIVHLSRLPEVAMIVNENGYNLHLPVNIVASGLYGSAEHAILGDVFFASFYCPDPMPDEEVYAFDLIAGLRVKSVLDLLLKEYKKANLI